MADDRGVWVQTKSGLRLAFSVVGALISLGILTKGLLLVRSGTRMGVVEGAAVIFLICVLAFVTTPRWAKWFFGVCCLMVLRGRIKGRPLEVDFDRSAGIRTLKELARSYLTITRDLI